MKSLEFLRKSRIFWSKTAGDVSVCVYVCVSVSFELCKLNALNGKTLEHFKCSFIMHNLIKDLNRKLGNIHNLINSCKNVHILTRNRKAATRKHWLRNKRLKHLICIMKSYDKSVKRICEPSWRCCDDDNDDNNNERMCLNNDVLSNVDTAIIIYCVLTQKQNILSLPQHIYRHLVARVREKGMEWVREKQSHSHRYVT